MVIEVQLSDTWDNSNSPCAAVFRRILASPPWKTGRWSAKSETFSPGYEPSRGQGAPGFRLSVPAHPGGAGKGQLRRWCVLHRWVVRPAAIAGVRCRYLNLPGEVLPACPCTITRS